MYQTESQLEVHELLKELISNVPQCGLPELGMKKTCLLKKSWKCMNEYIFEDGMVSMISD